MTAKGNAQLQLLICGAAALFWELLLIRWMGSCIRIVAYYTNFVLIAAFFGLGAGTVDDAGRAAVNTGSRTSVI